MDQIHAGETDSLDRFLAAIESLARLPPHVRSSTAAAVTMCTLAARLTKGQASLLLRGFPAGIQMLLGPCITHRYGPVEKLDDAGFLQRIAHRLAVTPAHAELICACVFDAARAELPANVIDHVTAQLPRDLRALWLGTTPLAEVAMAEPTMRTEILADIADRAALPVQISASDAFAAVMCNFSQRLSGGEARDVFLGLPDTIRPLIERCIYHRDEPGAVFDRVQFVSSVANDLGLPLLAAEQIVAGVLAAVKRALPQKEVGDVASQLPADLRGLWESA